MPVEIESILQHEDVQLLLETSEASGNARQSELNDLTELHEFDVFELDLLYRELETRGVEIVDDTREVEKAPPPPPPPPAARLVRWTQAANCGLVITCAVWRMNAWPRPQSSAQTTGHSPVLVGVIR